MKEQDVSSEVELQGVTAAPTTAAPSIPAAPFPTSAPSTNAASTASVLPSANAASLTSVEPSTGGQLKSDAEPSSCHIQSSATALKEILTYPTLEASGPAKRKNAKRSIPNFVSGPESMQILLDEKLKKAR